MGFKGGTAYGGGDDTGCKISSTDTTGTGRSISKTVVLGQFAQTRERLQFHGLGRMNFVKKENAANTAHNTKTIFERLGLAAINTKTLNPTAITSAEKYFDR